MEALRAITATAAGLALALGTLVGCAPTPTPGSVDVREGETATLTVEGVTVDIPGDSISGAGTLVVEPADQEGHEGWNIELTEGATLTGPATLTFAGTVQEGEPAPIVMSSPEAGADLTPVDSVVMTEAGAQVVTTHFSNWMVTWWKDLIDPVKKIWNATFSGGSDDAKLGCVDSAAAEAAGYKTTGPGGDDQRATWCAGMAGGRPELQVKNERGYPMLVEASVGLAQQDADESFEMLVAQLFTVLGEGPSKSGASIYPLLSKDMARYLVANASPQSLIVSSNPSAYVAQILRFAIDTALQFPGLLGKSVAKDRILDAIQAGDCIRGFGQLAGADPQSTDAVMGYLETGIGAAFDCVGDVMKQVFASDALLITVATGIAWIGKGANLIGGAGQAVGDMLSNVGNPYKVTVTGTDRWLITSDGVGPLTLGTRYDELEPLIPAGNRGCIPYAEEPWSAHLAGADATDTIYIANTQYPLPDEESTVAPLTEQGVTIGTPESVLVELGYQKQQSAWALDHFDYVWQENGVSFVAGTGPDGRVGIIGVGTDYLPIELCA